MSDINNINELYELANSYVENDELDKAIPLFKKTLEGGNYHSAFRLGIIYLDCYEDLGMETPNYKEVFNYFKIGAENGDVDSQYELSNLYADGPKKIRNTYRAIYWILKCNNCKDIVHIKKLIKIMYLNVDNTSIVNMQDIINKYNKLIKMTNEKEVLKELFARRNLLITNSANLVIETSLSIEELYTNFKFYNKYANKIFMREVLYKYHSKEVKLFLESCSHVQLAIEFLLEFNNKSIEAKEKVLEDLYLWIARSYKDGVNGVKKSIDEALKYYALVKTQPSVHEKDKMLFDICIEYIEKGMCKKANAYLKYIDDFNMSKTINDKLTEYNNREYFNYIYKEASAGNYAAKFKLANLYEAGIGTCVNISSAISIYNELFELYRTKDSFDKLFAIYDRSNNKECLIDILKKGLNYRIEFDSNQNKKYCDLIVPYATSLYNVVSTKGLTQIDTEGNVIYYLFDYYKKWWIENYPDIQYYKDNYSTFISVKKRNLYNLKLNFPGALYNFFELLEGDWIICTVPGHEQTTNVSNGVFDIIKKVFLKSNFCLINTLIQRKYSVEKKATASNGRINCYLDDMPSLKLDSSYNIGGKNIIVVDDITTSGSSLIACKNILMNAGAKRVVLVALGKTKEPNYGF